MILSNSKMCMTVFILLSMVKFIQSLVDINTCTFIRTIKTKKK